MPAPRHGRKPAFSKPIAGVFVVVGLGVLAVGALAEVGLALRLAVAGALVLSVMVWSVYAEALASSRRETVQERALHSVTTGELRALRQEHERRNLVLNARITRLEAALDAATPMLAVPDAPVVEEMWPDLADAPTVVDFANRRENRTQEPAAVWQADRSSAETG